MSAKPSNPQEYQFEGQREGEAVVMIFRRHILTTFKGIFVLVLLTGLGIIPMFIWKNESAPFFIWLACFAFGLIFALWEHMLWHFSVFIVTNQRIRQITQHGLFKKTVVDLGLDKIQSVSYHVPGLFGSIFNYGTILIQTTVGDMTINMIPHPGRIYEELQSAIGEA